MARLRKSGRILKDASRRADLVRAQAEFGLDADAANVTLVGGAGVDTAFVRERIAYAPYEGTRRAAALQSS